MSAGTSSEPGRAFRWRPFIAFEDTNLVGNVYFARFVSWQGRCREAFLAEHAPEILADLAADLRLVTLNLSCDFFEELRAFDAVEIEMRLTGRQGHRVRLSFDYRLERDGAVCLAARGSQEIACMRQTEGRPLVPAPLPAALALALDAYAPVG
ncbi:MAG TPA: acyl-CoA thioesterase [Allosphingosinicella sp.]|jgi:enediyne biosynthesis thioesterase